MNDLKEFFEDIKGIRKALESLVAQKSKDDCAKEEKEPQIIDNSSVVQNQIQAPTMTIPSTVPNTIPLAQSQVESFTQEQIAVAMSNAMAVGKNDVVQNILTSFNAQCLMQIDAANYNKIATMLREAGIQI